MSLLSVLDIPIQGFRSTQWLGLRPLQAASGELLHNRLTSKRLKRPKHYRLCANRRFMERKYKQRGYQQDETREQKPQQSPQRSDVRSPKMPAFREVTRCSLCGTQVNIEVGGIALDAQCPKCHMDLHSCKNCLSFDPGARFQCRKPITERIVKKDLRNSCEIFEPRKTIERETTAASTTNNDPRSAFDKLFKI